MAKTGAPCEACGRLLPSKPISRSSTQCPSPWLQPNQTLQLHHSQTLPGSATASDLEINSRPSSTNSDDDDDDEDPSCNKQRSYDSVLEEIEAIFAGFKVKRATIKSYADLCQRRRDRIAKHHEHGLRETASRSRSPTATCSVNSPPHRRQPVCRRVVGQLPSNCSFDPLRISPSPSHHRGEQSQRQPPATRRRSSPSCSPSLDPDSSPSRSPRPEHDSSPSRSPRPDHEAVDSPHQQACRSNRVDHYHDVLQLYEECHIHEIDERITTATLITSPRKQMYERGFQTHEPRQILYQHVCQQTVVRHHESCHLHHRAPMSLKLRCHRCGCSLQDRSAEDQCNTGHHLGIGGSSKQEATALNLCRPVTHPKGMACEDLQGPTRKLDDERTGTIQACHLHCKESTDACKEFTDWCKDSKDPLQWGPRRVWKAKKPCAVHWLDRVTASQHIPSRIVRHYLQGKRRCSPRWRKQNCGACVEVGKKVDPCAKPAAFSWNSGSVISSPVAECKEWMQDRGKLSRLALSRVLIVKPVPKVSVDSQGLWTRKELELCSECVGTKSGRWPSILETMSPSPSSLCIADQQQHDEMASSCSTKYSCHTLHGLAVPEGGISDLRGPELNSTSRLRRKLHKLQNETFDRRAAMQVARMEGIELDKEVLELLPDSEREFWAKAHTVRRTSSQKESSRRAHTIRRRKARWEVYRGLSKIVQLTTPPCQQCAPREVGCQVYGRNFQAEFTTSWQHMESSWC